MVHQDIRIRHSQWKRADEQAPAYVLREIALDSAAGNGDRTCSSNFAGKKHSTSIGGSEAAIHDHYCIIDNLALSNRYGPASIGACVPIESASKWIHSRGIQAIANGDIAEIGIKPGRRHGSERIDRKHLVNSIGNAAGVYGRARLDNGCLRIGSHYGYTIQKV